MVGMDISLLEKYFDLTPHQKEQFGLLADAVKQKNQVVNLISRKDEENLWERHILHSLAIAKMVEFGKGARVLDVGTGGGFPGLPLAIMFPNAQFTLVDSIQKKITAVNEFIQAVGIQNVQAEQIRAEKLKGNFDFVVSRAVTSLDLFTKWIWKNLKSGTHGKAERGIYYLRGPDIDPTQINSQIHRAFSFETSAQVSSLFDEPFFSTKTVVFLRRVKD